VLTESKNLLLSRLVPVKSTDIGQEFEGSTLRSFATAEDGLSEGDKARDRGTNLSHATKVVQSTPLEERTRNVL